MSETELMENDDQRLFEPNPGRFNENPKGIRFWTFVTEDFSTHGSDLASQGFGALFRHRFGNGVDNGADAVIVGRVKVGDDVIVGANAVVFESVPRGAVVGGIPAHILRMRDPSEIRRHGS